METIALAPNKGMLLEVAIAVGAGLGICEALRLRHGGENVLADQTTIAAGCTLLELRT